MGKTRPMPVVWLEGAVGEMKGAGAARFAALGRSARYQTTVGPTHERLAEMDAAGVALQSGVRIDELSVHRDVLTGAPAREAWSPAGILFRAYRPKLEPPLAARR